MKKIFYLLIVLMTMLFMSGCSNKDNQNNPEISNPKVQYDSLDEINSKCNVNLVKPTSVNVSNETFYVIDEKTAEYDFDFNNVSMIMRAVNDTSYDASGIYIDGKTLFENATNYANYMSETDNYYAMRLIIDDSSQYIMAIYDENGIDSNESSSYYSLLDGIRVSILNNVSGSSTNNLVGTYQDSVGQRATAAVSIYDKDVVLVTVTWPNDANSMKIWSLICDVDGNKLTYNDGMSYVVDYTNDVNGEYKDVEQFLTGYFEVVNNKISWTGSNDPTTSESIFEKIS